MTGTASTDKRRETVTSFVRRNREAGKSRIFSYYALDLDDLERLLAIAEAATVLRCRWALLDSPEDIGRAEAERNLDVALAAFRDPETERPKEAT